MAALFDIAVHGLDELPRKLNGQQLIGAPLRSALQEAALFAEREARIGAPRDTAALQRSITHEVSSTMARVYSPLVYAQTMEVGRRSGGPLPPPAALTGWARRHGFAPGMEFVLARSIARKGIRGRFFMKRAAEKLTNELPRLLGRMAQQIEIVWSR